MTRLRTLVLHFLTLPAVMATILSHPPGPYGTATHVVMLTDRSREDPYAAAAGQLEHRRVVISAFYPAVARQACIEVETPYMPNTTAVFYDDEYGAYGIPEHAFSSLQMTFCAEGRHAHNLAAHDFPVLLFSPGLGNSRLIYSAMAQFIATQGHVVLTIDHPYDADIVEFPDGSFVLAANITTQEQIEAALDVRVQDVLFLLGQFQSNPEVAKILGQDEDTLAGKNRIISMFGHSLGGATAATAAMSTDDLVAAINLDGTFFGSILSQGSRRPLAIVAHDNKTLTTDPSWAAVWAHTRNETEVAVQLAGTAHGSFTDFPIILDALNVTQDFRKQLAPLIGSAPSSRILKIIGSVVSHFILYASCLRSAPLAPWHGNFSDTVSLLGEVLHKQRCI